MKQGTAKAIQFATGATKDQLKTWAMIEGNKLNETDQGKGRSKWKAYEIKTEAAQ